jgi:iron(III) transport system substrate-binding protein
MNYRYLLMLGCAFAAASCGEREPAAKNVEQRSQLNQEPVVVYASYDDETYLPALFTGFTRDTGIRVTLRYADARTLVNDVIGKRGSPPADLLLTPTAHGVWRAADEGALRPLGSDVVEELVPAQFRDPDGYWTGVTLQSTRIVFDTQAISLSDLREYEDLGNPAFRKMLCLTSSKLAANRSLLGMLIKSHGVRPAEIIVRGWMQNLALPPFKSESDLMRAIDAGSCSLGIVSNTKTRLILADMSGRQIGMSTPEPVHVITEAIGINRHAREPEAARQLLEWLLTAAVQDQHASATATRPVLNGAAGQADSWSQQMGEGNVAAAAWLHEDAVKLAERAGYR